jgi:hypothetical protein
MLHGFLDTISGEVPWFESPNQLDLRDLAFSDLSPEIIDARSPR